MVSGVVLASCRASYPEQPAQLANDFAELLRLGVHVAQDGELVKDRRVARDVQGVGTGHGAMVARRDRRSGTAWLEQFGLELLRQPRLERVMRPPAFVHQGVVQAGIRERPHRIGGTLRIEAHAKASPLPRLPHDGRGAAAPLLVQSLPDGGRFRVGRGRRPDGDVDRRQAPRDVGHDPRVPGEEAMGVGLRHDGPTSRAIAERDGLVVADQRHVVGGLEQSGLRREMGEHGRSTDLRGSGDRVDRGGDEPTLGEQLGGSRRDPALGLACLRGPTRRHIRALDRFWLRADTHRMFTIL